MDSRECASGAVALAAVLVQRHGSECIHQRYENASNMHGPDLVVNGVQAKVDEVSGGVQWRAHKQVLHPHYPIGEGNCLVPCFLEARHRL